MSAAEPHEQRQPVYLSRVPIATSAAICGVMAIASVVAVSFAYFRTPEVLSIPIVGDHITITQSKMHYLLAPPLFSMILFSILAYYTFRWIELSRQIAQIAQIYRERFVMLRHINISILYKVSCILFSIYQAGTLRSTKAFKGRLAMADWAGLTVTVGGTLSAGVPFVTSTGAVGGGVYSTGFGGPTNNGLGSYGTISSDTVDGKLVGGDR